MKELQRVYKGHRILQKLWRGNSERKRSVKKKFEQEKTISKMYEMFYYGRKKELSRKPPFEVHNYRKHNELLNEAKTMDDFWTTDCKI